MTILAVGMAASTIACLTWGLLVRSAHLPGVAAHDGILNSPFLGSWLVVLAMMAAATSLAVVATGKQVRSGRRLIDCRLIGRGWIDRSRRAPSSRAAYGSVRGAPMTLATPSGAELRRDSVPAMQSWSDSDR